MKRLLCNKKFFFHSLKGKTNVKT